MAYINVEPDALLILVGPHPGDSQSSKRGKRTVSFGWNLLGSLCLLEQSALEWALGAHSPGSKFSLCTYQLGDLGPVIFLCLDNPLLGLLKGLKEFLHAKHLEQSLVHGKPWITIGSHFSQALWWAREVFCVLQVNRQK